MKIKFTQDDRAYPKGTVLEVGSGVAQEYIKRGVAEAIGGEAKEKSKPKK